MINQSKALKIILVIGIAGILFSGYLSYTELFASGCTLGCSATTGSILGLPPCVYGLVMYTILTIVAVLALLKPKAK